MNGLWIILEIILEFSYQNSLSVALINPIQNDYFITTKLNNSNISSLLKIDITSKALLLLDIDIAY